MICCDVQLVCKKCNKDTMVHLERKTMHERGFGCLTCKTAIKKGNKYIPYEKP